MVGTETKSATNKGARVVPGKLKIISTPERNGKIKCILSNDAYCP